jgi:hypothetical protein
VSPALETALALLIVALAALYALREVWRFWRRLKAGKGGGCGGGCGCRGETTRRSQAVELDPPRRARR